MGAQQIKRAIVPILKKHDVIRAGLFGSFAKQKATGKSDVDVLVEFRGSKTLLNLIKLRLALEAKLGRPVDVVTYKSLNPHLRERILHEQVPLV